MADTLRTASELLTLFADGQASGAITPQDMRDLIVTMQSQHGWGEYVDTEYSSGSPQLIDADTFTTIQNNAGSTREQELPYDVALAGGFYDADNDKIVGVRAGDGKLLTVEFTIDRQSASGSFVLETAFNIGSPVGQIYPRTFTLPGNGAFKQTFSTAAFALDTWAANGCSFEIRTSVATKVWGARHIIHRLHRGVGDYS